MGKTTTLLNQKKISLIGGGLCWMLYGIFSMFDNIPCSIIAILFIACDIALSFMKTDEEDDEMSKYNMLKSRAIIGVVMSIMILFVLFVIVISEMTLLREHIIEELYLMIISIVGLTRVLMGIYFARLENGKHDIPVSKTKICEYRKERNMQTAMLAELTSVRTSTIEKIESGTYAPSLKLACDIAGVFGCNVEELFSFIEDEDKNE